jgi:hypothetical protein
VRFVGGCWINWAIVGVPTAVLVGSPVGCGGAVQNKLPMDGAAPSDVMLPADASVDSVATDPGDAAAENEQPVFGDDGALRCALSSDCPQPSAQYCVPCFEGGVTCARSECVGGSCQGLPPTCPGPITNPCAYKSCGDPCQQCSTSDGGCYPGSCSWFGSCKAAVPVCSMGATRGCAPSDAVGVGDCNYFLGWGWDGSKCLGVVGCLCQGSDCGMLLGSYDDCHTTFSLCSRDAG